MDWVRCSMPPNSLRVHTGYVLVKSVVPYLNCEDGDRWCRHLYRKEFPPVLQTLITFIISLRELHRAKSRLTRTTGVHLAPCQDEFRGPRSGYVRQVALETTSVFLSVSILNAPRSGRPVEADKDAIKALVDANRRITTREIGSRLNLLNSTVYDHLKCLGLSLKLDVWVPHVITERNLCHRINVCDSLLKRHENDQFLKRIITEDEKAHGAKKMNRLKPFPKPTFTKKR
ncbi:histone-lysine N-methyltransferase SETMAR [Trichonephila clavipes]|uniref:Histone-lysine N-methyltransferase SETMAR n=1 Tax=Trichonephila clavipes TaxID=2585209 RepID=A0A8X6RZC3_TRICX|nr:histone-lysine N-methyltransferase SETMAR [Trichonephila clavipes]